MWVAASGLFARLAADPRDNWRDQSTLPLASLPGSAAILPAFFLSHKPTSHFDSKQIASAIMHGRGTAAPHVRTI